MTVRNLRDGYMAYASEIKTRKQWEGGVPSADALLFKTRVQMCLFRNDEVAYSAGCLDNNRVDEQIHPCCHVIDYASDITAPNRC